MKTTINAIVLWEEIKEMIERKEMVTIRGMSPTPAGLLLIL